jgi:signal transduction histidine kinase
MEEPKMANETLKFSVDSQLLGELGERLVTRNYIALAELVKNAYDADANGIQIRLINVKKDQKNHPDDAEIYLIDDGHGMTFNEIKANWMRIATSNKIRSPISQKYGRRKTGSKGVGRFACRRLAKQLILESTAKIPNTDQYEYVKVTFDWENYILGTSLTEIDNYCTYETKLTLDGTTGVTLKLCKLTELWSERDFNLLRRQILSVAAVGEVRRNGHQKDPGFKVEFDAPEFPAGKGLLVDELINAGWGTLDGLVSDGVTADEQGNVKKIGVCTLKLDAKRIGRVEYVFPESYPSFAGLKFRIAWIPLEKDTFRNPKVLTLSKSKEILPEQSGIRIYYDGFRVYPYGEPYDDWLKLEKDVARRTGSINPIFKDIASEFGLEQSRPWLGLPSYNRLIGKIEISSHYINTLEMKLDREGFIENEDFNIFRNLIRSSIDWMVLQYARFKQLRADEEVRESEENYSRLTNFPQEDNKMGGTTTVDPSTSHNQRKTDVFTSAITTLASEAKRGVLFLPKEDRQKTEKIIDAAASFIEHTFDSDKIFQQNLSALASTGTLLFGFSHEIKGLIADLDTHATTIRLLKHKMPPDTWDELNGFSGELQSTRDHFDGYLNLFGTIGLKAKELEKKELPIRKVAAQAIKSFGYLINHYHISEPQLEIPVHLRTGLMREIELYSIFLNLISNSIKAIIASEGKSIKIEALKQNGMTVLRIYDDGVGLSKANRARVFQPMVSDPESNLYTGLLKVVSDEDLAALGRGTGIGLSIVKNTTESYGGRASFIDVDHPWKTCVEVVIP